MNINVYTESTPNPATMKFIVNKLLINGSVDYPTKESAENSPFAKELYKRRVFHIKTNKRKFGTTKLFQKKPLSRN